METKSIYISILIVLVLSGLITAVLNSFAPDLEPKELPLGANFVSGLLGNDFNILEDNTNPEIDIETEIKNLNYFNYTFLLDFKDNFPNYESMNELRDKQTQELIYISKDILLNGSETVIFTKEGVNSIYAPQPSTFLDKFICSFRYFCNSVENYKLVEIYKPSREGILRKINPFGILIPETLRNEIDKQILLLGHLPKIISTPIMLIVLLGFSIFAILITIQLLSLLPFN